ncbi:hypothetical protein [Senegalia massiliensis]|uniref:hypothetical protein n=1 Tax=Senegalia massiliensis TaxID=1720316 RepID=UPI00102F9BF4|nr:hypothetical protein [Senegalia massiliensis]
MKPYYENINLDFLQIFSMIIYLVIFFFLLTFISKKLLLKDDKFNKYYFITILGVYFILLIGDIKFDYIPLFPDTELYYNFLNNSGSFISPIELSRGFGLFSRTVYLFSFNNIGIYLLFNAIINQIGILLLWKSFMIYKKDKVTIKNQRLFLIFSAIYPVSIIYALTLLRESYFIFSFSIFLIGVMKKEKINLVLILGSILVVIFRIQYIVFCFLIYIIKLVFSNKKYIKYKIGFITFLSPFMYKTINWFTSKFLGIGLNAISLRDFRNMQRNRYLDKGTVYPEVDWSNWIELFKDYPALIIQFLLTPFPILVEYDFLNSIAYTIDAIYVIVVLTLFLINLRYTYKNVFWIFTLIVIIALSSMFEYFFTGGVRHRYTAIIMLIPLIFSDKKENLNGSRSFNVFHRYIKN